MFTAEPDLSEFIVEEYAPPPRPQPASRAAPRPAAPAAAPQATARDDGRSVDGGGEAELAAAQRARRDRIAAARAAAFGTDDGHFEGQQQERARQPQPSDSGYGYGSQGNSSGRSSIGQVRGGCAARSGALQVSHTGVYGCP